MVNESRFNDQQAGVVPAQHSTGDWRSELRRLDGLGLALLPIGLNRSNKADEGKGPINPHTGYGLSDWQKHQGFPIPLLQTLNGVVTATGTRTGKETGLMVFDLDGRSAIEEVRRHGCDPDQVNTWQVHRTTDPYRLKVMFRPTPEQIALLPIDEFQARVLTKPAVKDTNGKVLAKGEAAELFFDPGRQVVVLGQHIKSQGFYVWPEGLGPEVLAPPPEAWFALAVRLANEKLAEGSTRRSASTSRRSGARTSRLCPCPICGRNENLWCEQTDRGLIFCMPGNTFSAVQAHGVLKVSDVVKGTDGNEWAVKKITRITEGDVHVFGIHQLREPRPAVQAPDPFPPLAAPLAPQPAANGSTPPLAIDAAAIRQHLEDERRDNTHPYVTAASLLPAALAAPLHLRSSRLNRPDIILMAPLFATFASVLPRGIDVMLNEGTNYVQRPIIRTACIAKTGSGKSGNAEIGPKILSRLQAEALAQHKEEHGEDDEDAPPPRTYIINNFTIQGLMHAAEESKNHNCLLYVDELAALFRGLDQYTKGSGKGNEGALFLSLYDGIGFTGKYAEKSRRYSVASTGYSVTGTIQYEVLADCMDNLNDTSGEWARWNFVEAPLHNLKAHRGDKTPDGLEAFVEETIDNLSALGACRYRLDRYAQMVFDDFYDRQGELANDPTIPPAVQAKHAKAMGSAGRFALLLHLVHAVWTDDPLQIPPAEISRETMDQAIILTEYFTAQHRSLYRRLLNEGSGDIDADAIYVFGLCKRLHQQHKPITPQHIRAAWTRKVKPKTTDCSAFIDALLAAGFLHLASGGGLAPAVF